MYTFYTTSGVLLFEFTVVYIYISYLPSNRKDTSFKNGQTKYGTLFCNISIAFSMHTVLLYPEKKWKPDRV